MNRPHIKSIFIAFTFLMAQVSCGDTVLYVDDDAAPGGNGRSWQTAYRYLQDALADADSAETPVDVRIAEGIYKPDQGDTVELGDRRASFRVICAALRGGYAGLGAPDPNTRNIAQYETVQSGDLAGDDGPRFANYGENSYTVVTAGFGGFPSHLCGLDFEAVALLEGLVVTSGSAFDPDPQV